MQRRVRGILFVDYVRMIRGTKGVDWDRHLTPDDAPFLSDSIDPNGWYPMETFERFGLAIGEEIAKGQLEAARMWGRFQTDNVRAAFPKLVAPGEPRETLMRFQVLRKGFFDYDALEVVDVTDDAATVSVAYQMGAVAEEAATHQTLGFLERLVELAGGEAVFARLRAEAWKGAPRSLIEIHWRCA
jgi:hypothetical protein